MVVGCTIAPSGLLSFGWLEDHGEIITTLHQLVAPVLEDCEAFDERIHALLESQVLLLLRPTEQFLVVDRNPIKSIVIQSTRELLLIR